MATRNPRATGRATSKKSTTTLTPIRSKPSPADQPTDGIAAGKKKPKLLRERFTIPENEFAALSELKTRAGRIGRPAKKSEILRAGIGALKQMSDAAFLAALGTVPGLKSGPSIDADKSTAKRAAKKR